MHRRFIIQRAHEHTYAHNRLTMNRILYSCPRSAYSTCMPASLVRRILFRALLSVCGRCSFRVWGVVLVVCVCVAVVCVCVAVGGAVLCRCVGVWPVHLFTQQAKSEYNTVFVSSFRVFNVYACFTCSQDRASELPPLRLVNDHAREDRPQLANYK